jgi:hypothetical protein
MASEEFSGKVENTTNTSLDTSVSGAVDISDNLGRELGTVDQVRTIVNDVSRTESGSYTTLASAADISTGVSASVSAKAHTLMINTDAAIDITVEVSPDAGTNWYEIPESPFSYGSASQDVAKIEYNMDQIRLTGSNSTTAVTAQLAERQG